MKNKNKKIIKEIKYKYQKKNEYYNIIFDDTIEKLNNIYTKIKNKYNIEKEKIKI